MRVWANVVNKGDIDVNPITNSPIKEAMRQHYHSIAASKETQINNQLRNDCTTVQNDAADMIRSMKHKNSPSGYALCGLALGGGFLFLGDNGFNGFIVGIIIGVVVYICWLFIINKINKELDADKVRIQSEADREVQQLKDKAASQIRTIYAKADQKTQYDIDQYDADVKRNCQMILKKPDAFSVMVEHTVNMFQRMVSHADSASNKKFVETDFTFKVELYGICYKYQSTYSNPKDDFNFDKQRYRNLTTKEECEGLAQAITIMTKSKMKSLYPPNSLNIKVRHIDAQVTLHFKSANKNYIPPRDIYRQGQQ